MGPSNKLTFDLESDVRVTSDVGYLCANFSLRRPLCFRLRPILLLVAEFAVTPELDVTRREPISVERQTHSSQREN